jgi:hypothetical protein
MNIKKIIKQENKLYLILILGLLIISILVVFNLNKKEDFKVSDAVKFKEEYENLNGVISKDGIDLFLMNILNL